MPITWYILQFQISNRFKMKKYGVCQLFDDKFGAQKELMTTDAPVHKKHILFCYC